MSKSIHARVRKHDVPSWGHGPKCITCLEALPYGVDAILDAMGNWVRAVPDGLALPPAVQMALDDLDDWSPIPGIRWNSSEAELIAAGMW